MSIIDNALLFTAKNAKGEYSSFLLCVLRVLCGLQIGLLLLPLPLHALDHRNLDEQAPLEVEDAYPLKYRELAVQILGFYRDADDDTKDGGAYLELEYGLARNLQLSVSTEIFSRSPGESEGSGNPEIDLLYNFNTETMRAPAFAVSAGTELPAGVGEQGTDVFLHGIITRSFRHHRVHFNGGYTFTVDSLAEDRDGRWQGVIGWDHRAGLHGVVLADFVVRQSERREGSTVTHLEFGFRRQLTPQLVFQAGVGAGLSGGIERNRFTLRAGFSRSL